MTRTPRQPCCALRHTSRSIWRQLLAIPVVVTVVTTAACGAAHVGASGSGDEKLFPAKGLRVIVASSAGGGYDRATRQIQPAMTKALGVKMNLEYQASADGAVANSILEKAPDCTTLVASADTKMILSQYLQKVDYTYQNNFASIGGFTRDYDVIMTTPNSQYSSLQSLITAAKAKPKGVTMAVGSIAADGLPIFALEKATGVTFNVVPFGSGSDANNALLGGKAAVAESSVFNSLALKGKVKITGVLADENPAPDQTNHAPTANSALKIKLEPQVNDYGLFVSKACTQKFPKQYQALQSALKNSLQDAAFKSTVSKLGLSGWYVYTPAAKFDKAMIDEEPSFKQIVDEQGLASKS